MRFSRSFLGLPMEIHQSFGLTQTSPAATSNRTSHTFHRPRRWMFHQPVSTIDHRDQPASVGCPAWGSSSLISHTKPHRIPSPYARPNRTQRRQILHPWIGWILHWPLVPSQSGLIDWDPDPLIGKLLCRSWFVISQSVLPSHSSVLTHRPLNQKTCVLSGRG